MRYRLSAAFAVAFVASVTPAMANVEVGQLECRGVSQQFVVGSVTNLQCLFRPSSGVRPTPYDAQIRRVGVDIGINQSTVLNWSVFAPTHRLSRGDLSGTYVGASANATVGVGVGANALWGGSSNTIALQPLSGQGQIGLGVAGGVSAMEMRPHEMPRVRRHRHRR
ncbi:MAG: hypothetical protein QOF91_2665 [Alphaproteobacteria bacterium]|jgi:hypothetical protein|nr:hypothetical protein [Alphaproteobacteria bacterium]